MRTLSGSIVPVSSHALPQKQLRGCYASTKSTPSRRNSVACFAHSISSRDTGCPGLPTFADLTQTLTTAWTERRCSKVQYLARIVPIVSGGWCCTDSYDDFRVATWNANVHRAEVGAWNTGSRFCPTSETSSSTATHASGRRQPTLSCRRHRSHQHRSATQSDADARMEIHCPSRYHRGRRLCALPDTELELLSPVLTI